MNTTTVELAPESDRPRYHELPPFARFQRRVWAVQDLVNSDPGRLGPPISGETAGLAVRYAEALDRRLYPLEAVHVRSDNDGSLNLEWAEAISLKVRFDPEQGPQVWHGTVRVSGTPADREP